MEQKNKCCLCGHDPNSDVIKERCRDIFLTTNLMNTLTRPFTEFASYKMGLISEHGDLLKRATTQDEKDAWSLQEQYLIKLKKLLGNKLEILNTSLYLESYKETDNINHYISEQEVKRELEFSAKRFKEAIDKASDLNLPLPILDRIIVESFTKI